MRRGIAFPLLVVAMAATSACAPAAAPGLRSVTYETGPCLVGCALYRVTVNADGTALFEGRRFTVVTGPRRFAVTPAQFQALAARLAPYRPAAGERRYAPPNCHVMTTDQGSVTIVWTGTEGVQSLYVDLSCDADVNRAMDDTMRSVPSDLPIGDYIRRGR